MGNKSDLRVKRTKKLIEDAFIEMRKTMPMRKIKVRALCEKAMINPSTFYKYYEDIYDLSRHIEEKIMDRFFSDFHAEKEIFSDPEAWLKAISKTDPEEVEIIDTLYRENRLEEYMNALRRVLKLYENMDLEEEEYLRLVFAVSGGMMTRVLLEEWEEEKLEKELASCIERVLKE